MLTFVADQPRGPFVAAPKNFRLLTGDCYFARFVPTPDGLLVTHHTISRVRRGTKQVVYAAPMKRALVDAAGTMRLGWWQGNNALKGTAQNISVPRQAGKDGTGQVFMADRINVLRGTILEANVDFEQSPGLVFESIGGELTAIRLVSATATEAGTLQPDGTKFTALPRQSIHRDLPAKPSGRLRVLLRHSLVELYLDDVLFNVLKLPRASSGRVGLLHGATGIRDIEAWTMTLPDEAAP
jgi:hypothetical protein